MGPAGTEDLDADSQGATSAPCKFLIKGAPHTIENVFTGEGALGINLANGPSQDIEVLMLDGKDPPVLHGDDGAALGSGLLNMSALDISREQNPGVLV